jgi:hypothetical protein
MVVNGEASLMKAGEGFLEDSYGSSCVALIKIDPVMEWHDGFCVVNVAVAKE